MFESLKESNSLEQRLLVKNPEKGDLIKGLLAIVSASGRPNSGEIPELENN